VAEALGTYFLVFAATGAVAVDAVTHGTLGNIGMSLACGLVAFAMIEAIGDVSGAHMNPAVSVGFALAGRFPWRQVPGYVVAQFVGGRGAIFMGVSRMLRPAMTIHWMPPKSSITVPPTALPVK
jgi:aquaporin Z